VNPDVIGEVRPYHSFGVGAVAGIAETVFMEDPVALVDELLGDSLRQF